MTKLSDMIIRREVPADFRPVEELTREAFWNHHVPGCDEHYLLHVMRDAPSFIPELDFVAELDGKIVGNIVYTRASLVEDGGRSHEVLCFGPLSVLPAYQNRGVGSALVEASKLAAKALGYRAILIYGDPEYYSRFGFVAAETYQIGSAEHQYAPALQALELVPGALSGIRGRFFEDSVFNVNEAEAEAFDRSFPPKALQEGLPSQLRFRHLVGLSRPMNEG